MIDAGLRGEPVSCINIIILYDTVAASPSMDMSGTPAEEQNAYGHYRSAVDIFLNGARDTTGNCRDLVNNPDRESTTIAPLQWTIARSAVNDAVNVITPGIQMLGGE